jgi:hypothetical protein
MTENDLSRWSGRWLGQARQRAPQGGGATNDGVRRWVLRLVLARQKGRRGSSPCCDAQGEENGDGEVVVAEIDVGGRHSGGGSARAARFGDGSGCPSTRSFDGRQWHGGGQA